MNPVAIEEKVAFYLFTYGFNNKKKKYKRKERSIRILIHLTKRV